MKQAKKIIKRIGTEIITILWLREAGAILKALYGEGK